MSSPQTPTRGDSVSPILIAVVGGSGSGKSWLTRKLSRRLGKCANILSLDDFYRDLSNIPLRDRATRNFDDPASIEWGLFFRTLSKIRSGCGETIELPRYNFETHTRQARPRRWKPGAFVLVDGLWLLRQKRVRQLFSFSIYIDCDESLRLERRLARDTLTRGRSRASVLRQFRLQVAPMHDRYVERQREYADLVFGPDMSQTDFSALDEKIRDLKRSSISLQVYGEKHITTQREREQMEAIQ